MKELGYVEGKNILVEYRYADGKSERLGDYAAQLVRSNIDLIIAEGAPQHMPQRMPLGPFRSLSGMLLTRLERDSLLTLPDPLVT